MKKEEKKEEENPVEGECWSKAQGYDCCEKRSTRVSYVDKKKGEEWGYEHGKWCGITDLQRCPSYSDAYPCCKGCTVKYTDSEKWGIENQKWCSIPYSCDEKK
ncbi:Non-catalytic module family DOC2 [Piromyces sp. E2]|nr:Non-catalytic module family DOC2 [Piromyces sp. E2]|eukprot:OUM59659.1 Non-catalytic module family DOC2 [Piromyces sp. E2]